MPALQTLWAACALALPVVNAAFPPTPEGVTIVESKKFPGVSLSYKETSICETTKGVKGYSGYVNLPPNPEENRNYESHMFFWFFEAREDPENAPLSIWLQGGPGVPSTAAALGETGPCAVLEDSKTTELSPWAWNSKVNMIYIDQPTQVGYSYDRLTNGTLDVVDSPFFYKPADFSKTGVPETNLTFLTGTFSSQDPASAPNTTLSSAPVIWDFMQAWIQEFPKYKSKTNTFSIWGESYAGHYNPIYADYFEEQNDKIADGSLQGSAIELHLDTVGLINPCIDIGTQMDFFPEFAFNNTYGQQLITDDEYTSALEASPECKKMSAECQAMAAEKDPRGLGNVADVNKACKGAFDYCFKNMHSAFAKSGKNKFDITQVQYPQAFPFKWPAGYLNDADIQKALGVPLNWTGLSIPIMGGFEATGDFILGDGLKKIGKLIDRGVKVALFFGDRDYQCNWLGGEAISLAIESKLSSDFKKAGYEEIKIDSNSESAGFVRQYDNLSFARVFQAGHEIPYYQPEAGYHMFNRVMFNKNVATGEESSKGYSSKGSNSAWSESEMPEPHGQAKCYLWDVMETCTKDEEKILRSGKAIVRDYILVGQE